LCEAPSTVAAITSRPENQLLVCCAQVPSEMGNADRIEALLQRSIDWEYVFEMAAEHRILPLVYWHLSSASSEAVPEDFLSRLRPYFRTNKLRALLLAKELLHLHELFERRGIPIIPYKGPVLAASVYGDLGLRMSGDLDILIRVQDVHKAKEMLVHRGYRPTPWKTDTQLTPDQEAAYLRFEREYPFQDYSSGIGVELQWGVMDKHFPFSLDMELAKERLQRVSLGGGTVPSFAPDVMLLVLCVHASVHLWERLQWICDVAETIRVCPMMDWNCLMKRAAALGSERMLLLGLHLAHELLGADIPENAWRRIKADTAVRALAAEVYAGLFQKHEESRGILEGSLFRSFHYRMHERRRDRFRYTLHTMIDPNLADWQRYPLPERLFPLYYVIRPVRLAGKYVLTATIKTIELFRGTALRGRRRP
jgi:Uncharacterised nucleotidyltransferase